MTKIERYKEQRRQQLDHVLRKIHKSGLDSLTDADIEFLDRVSAEIRHELGWDEEDPRTDYDDD